jgi:NAD(P)-dependent dehydrogenase (short-subunit alcohol dehydrogenase family)
MKIKDLPIGVDLNGKVAVITGAGGVICSTLAKAFATAGAKVALLDLSEEKAQARRQGKGI